MKKLAYLILAFSVLLLSVSLFALYIDGKVIQSKVFHASVNVTYGSIGFDLNGSALSFGKVSRGSWAKRDVRFDNKYDFPVVAEISGEGELVELLGFDSSVFAEGNEEIKVPFILSIPPYLEEGFYEGTIKFDIKPA